VCLDPIFWSLGLGLESLRSRLGLGLEGFWSRSQGLSLDTLHRLFFMNLCKKELLKNSLKSDCSKFSRSKRSAAKLSLLLCYLQDGENNFPSTPFKTYSEFNKKFVCTNETEAYNLCNETLGAGPALASPGPDWMHFCGAPFSGVCRHF